MRKKMVTSGLALGLVAGIGAGLALDIAGNAGAAATVTAAATTPADPTTPTTTPADTTGSTPAAPTDGTRPDPGTRLQETLQPLIDNGTITQAQADAVIAALKSAMPAGRPGAGDRHGGMGRPGADGASLDVVASTIGISVDDLRTALQSGSSIADVATAHGKTADEVIAAVVADRTAKINAEVTAGTITQAQADARIADLQTRVTDLVNNTRPARGERKFGGAPPAGADTGTSTGT